MSADLFSLSGSGWALAFGIAALIAVCAALMPLRWGWRAFPVAVLSSVLTTALVFVLAIGVCYEHGGGFLVHFNGLHLSAACLLGALAFGLIRKVRSDRLNG